MVKAVFLDRDAGLGVIVAGQVVKEHLVVLHYVGLGVGGEFHGIEIVAQKIKIHCYFLTY